jgi:hypothetical protein
MSLTNDSLPDILMEIIHVFEMEVYMKLFTVKDLYIPMHFFEMVKILEMAQWHFKYMYYFHENVW